MTERLKGRAVAHREVQVACTGKSLTVSWSVLKNDLSYTNDAGLLARTVLDSELEDEFDSMI